MKRRLLQLLSAAALGGLTTILADPQAISGLVPLPYQPVVGVGLGLLSTLLPSLLPQKARTGLWGAVPITPATERAAGLPVTKPGA
jgi:hypothetical protein